MSSCAPGGHLLKPPAPRIAVLIPVHRPVPEFLRLSLMSVMQQTLGDWELIVVDDASADPEIEKVLAWAGEHPAVTVLTLPERQGLGAASQAGLALVHAPWVALVDHQDLLEPSALEDVLVSTEAAPDAELIYTDLDSVDASGIPIETFLKPDWSPRRLRGSMYVSGLSVLATHAAREAGGFRSEFEDAQDYDLVFRVSERGRPVVHIPRVLYHRRELPLAHRTGGVTDSSPDRGVDAVQGHLDRMGIKGIAKGAADPGFYLVDYTPADCLVSVVIPTRGGAGRVHGTSRVYAVEAVRSILAYRYACDVEFVVVHDEDADPGYLEQLNDLAGTRLQVVPFRGPFNFSRKINVGTAAARGDMLVMLNDDIKVITPGWLNQLVAYAQEPDVGAVGAKLFLENGMLQHAGHFFGPGHFGHISAGRPDSAGFYGSNLVDREVVGVTAAVLAQRREVWQMVGGLDETLPNNFNDVDYCHRIRARGLRIVQANSASLYHFESRTRRSQVATWESTRMAARLGAQLERPDPYTSSDAAEWIPGRSLSEWVRVSRAVLREEGLESFSRKARRRLARR